MMGCPVCSACADACWDGEVSQQPMLPQAVHRRRCTHQPGGSAASHCAHPGPLGGTEGSMPSSSVMVEFYHLRRSPKISRLFPSPEGGMAPSGNERVTMISVTTPRRLLSLAAAGLVASAVVGYAAVDTGKIGPSKHETGNGRVLHPAGALTNVGNFPTGGALTPNGRYYWTVSTGRGFNDIRIVSTRKNRVIQTLPIPGASGGIVMDPRRHL